MCRFRKPLIAERVAGDRPPGAVAARGKIREGGEPSSSTLLENGIEFAVDREHGPKASGRQPRLAGRTLRLARRCHD